MIAAQRSSTRRWARLLPSLCVVGALAGCGTAGHSPGTADGTPIDADYFVSEHGVRVGIRVGFDQAREITAARMLWDRHADAVALYPLDGTDPDVALDSIDLEAGSEALLEGRVAAKCPRKPSTPVFEVVSRYGGERHTERFVPSRPGEFADAWAQWCERSVSMIIKGSTVSPEGDYELRVEFTNPGPGPVEIRSARVTDGTSTWRAAEVVVPGGSTAPLTIEGHGPPACAAVPPWETGHVLADGVPIAPPTDEGWC
jgi:hypothetical protein